MRAPKSSPLYINGQYISAPESRPCHSPLSEAERATLRPDAEKGLPAYSFLHSGSEQSAEIIEAALCGVSETFVQVKKGFFPLPERLAFFKRLYKQLQNAEESFARLLSEEIGKPLPLARAEVARALQNIEWTLIEASTFFAGQPLPMSSSVATDGAWGQVFWAPRGPLLAITPFNFPLNLALHKLLPAWAAGIPAILKPSPKAALSSLYLADICHSAKVPPGMLSVICCDDKLSEQVLLDERIAIASFTGSARVGWDLKRKAQPEKCFVLELGGQAPAYVHASADLDDAVTKVIHGAFAYAGQVCISTQHLGVDAAIAEDFVRKLKEQLQHSAIMGVGSALDESADQRAGTSLVGPIIDSQAHSRLQGLFDSAIAKGARLVAESPWPKALQSAEAKARYLPARVLADLPEEHEFFKEECFGPLLSFRVYTSEQDWVDWANTQKGRINASVFARDMKVAQKMAASLDYPTVLINQSTAFRFEPMPYGGNGEAGLGREGPRYAMQAYCQPKSILLF